MTLSRLWFTSTLVCSFLLAPTIARSHEGHHEEAAGDVEPMTIQAVVPGGAADTAGIVVGDRLVGLAGREISTMGDLEAVMGKHRPGQTVPVEVVRDGAPVELSLTFGERDGGRVALGVSLAVMQPMPSDVASSGAEAATAGDRIGREECLSWLDRTYRLEETARELGLELGDRLEELDACVARDLDRMSLPIPYGWCDNVFKVHCSALDLLAEVGEAQIAWCEERLEETMGIDLRAEKSWKTCGADRVFERYSLNGQTSDEAACREALEACSEGR